MKIEPLTGQTRFEDLDSVGPDLTKANFLKCHFKKFQLASSHGEWATYRGHIREIDGEFAITIIFEGERLFEVHLAKAKGPSSWTSWDEAEERRLKTELDSVLSKALGQSPGRFRWGEALSIYDAKSGASEIIIRYQR